MLDIYQVESSDTLDNIALRFNVSVDELLKANNINYPDIINVGTRLVIPQNKESYYNTYTIEEGDSLYKIARKYNINPELLAALNGLNFDDYIYPNQELLIPKNNYSYYLTTEGDTLNGVADVFKTDINKMLQENKTIYLMPGQLIVNKK